MIKFVKQLFNKKAKQQYVVHSVVEGRSEQFSFADMKDAFEAGDRFRLYLDKNAVGLGPPYDKSIPSSNKVMKTMCFEKWIEGKDKKKTNKT